MGPQQELILSLILGLSQPWYNSQWGVFQTPASSPSSKSSRTWRDLTGSSDKPCPLTMEETGTQRGIGARPGPHNPSITELGLDLKIPNAYLKLQQVEYCVTSAF